ncbi:hypothetical protein JXA59_02825 [Patescibacteria group bacterium]|nr:hypothetical protein [Patescibacteria group bacterium]
MNESLDPNDVLSELGLQPVFGEPTTPTSKKPTQPEPPILGLTRDEVLNELGLRSVDEAARNPQPAPPRPAQRAATPEVKPNPERTLEERFGATEKQRHPNSCVIACLLNAKKYIFGVKGLDTDDGVKLVEETLRDMATRHGFDESKGINPRGAQQLLEDNRHFAKQTESTEEALDFLDRGFGLIVSISFKQKTTGKVIRHALLIHAATDPDTGEKKILVRDTHMQPTDKHPGLREISRDELIGYLNGTEESWFKITNTLVIGPQGYKPDLSQETSEQHQRREDQVEAEVETLRKKLAELSPEERMEAKYRLEPAERLRIILKTFRPQANFANRKLTKHYNKAWELMYQTELNGSPDGKYGGILGGIETDLNKITAELKKQGTPEGELKYQSKVTLAKNMATAHAKLDRLERRYMDEAMYLSKTFTEIRSNDVAYAESLRATSRRAGAMALSVLRDKKSPMLMDWVFQPIRLEDVGIFKEIAQHAVDKKPKEDRDRIERQVENVGKIPVDVLMNREGKIQRAWSLYWWAKGLAKIARMYERPHGIDLADAHPYQEEELTHNKIGVWKDLKALKLEYYLSGGAVEVEDVDIEQNVIKIQTAMLQRQWPDGATPPEGTLKHAVNQKMGEIAQSGAEIPPSAMDAYEELDNMSHAYGEIGKKLEQLASEITNPDNVGDVENIKRIKDFFDLQEKVFELRHETALQMAELGAFLES